MTNIFRDLIFGENKRLEVVYNKTLSDFYDEFVKSFTTVDRLQYNDLFFTGKTYGTIENNEIKIWVNERSPFTPIFKGIITNNDENEIKKRGEFVLNNVSSILMLIIYILSLIMFLSWTLSPWDIELGIASIIFLILTSLSLIMLIHKSRKCLKTIRNKLKMINQ